MTLAVVDYRADLAQRVVGEELLVLALREREHLHPIPKPLERLRRGVLAYRRARPAEQAEQDK